MPRGAAVAGPGSSGLQRFTGTLQPRSVARHGALTLVWLHGGEAAPAPAVATFEEAQASGALLITERGSATVPELIVDNRGKVHVLLLAGEILMGGKQNRVLREDILLPPLSGPRSLSVYCVEQGRWSGGRKEFESKAYVAQPSLRRKLLDKDDQGRVWAEVDRSVRAQGIVPAPTSSYAQVYEAPEVRRRLDDVERAVDDRAAKGAVGAMVVIGDEVSALDAFQDAGLFSREWRKLLRAHAVEAYGRGVKAVPADEELRKRARALLDAVGGAAGSARGNAGVGQLFEFRLTEFRGAALDYEGRVVHLAVV
ncbi:MAG TPA: DUF6569 family protein [Candidatus Binatia bacterium]|nr:DUF6569 family protein [Candidatus Binatia bacterium]